VSGGSLALSDLSIEKLRKAIDAFTPEHPKEIEITRFRGHYFAVAGAGIVSLDEPKFGAKDQLPADLMVGAANIAMQSVPIEGMTWLDQYDAYYYDRDGELPLPVLRVRYADTQQTWLYVDAVRGTPLRKEERLTRLNRWLYHGLHSFDFPFLYYRRPFWDIVVIVLSAAGLALAVTTIAPAFRRFRRHARRLAR
jgi:hypothetical protein